jgi:hypothetical protein
VGAYSVVKCWVPHIIETIGSQMAGSLSALRHGRRSTTQKYYFSGTHFYQRLSTQGLVWPEGLSELIEIVYPIGSGTRYLPVCECVTNSCSQSSAMFRLPQQHVLKTSTVNLTEQLELFMDGTRYLCLEGQLCGLVVRVPNYRFKGAAFDSRRYQIF